MVESIKRFFRKVTALIRNKQYNRAHLRALINQAPNKLVDPKKFFDIYLHPKQYEKEPEVITELKNGLKIASTPKDIGVLSETCILEEYCPTSVFEIHPRDIVLDIGAHIGTFALYAAAKGATVYALEPNSSNYRMLERNIELNNLQSKIIPLNAALYSRSGQVGFNIDIVNSGGGNLTEDLAVGNKVLAITLSDLMKRFHLTRVDLMKIDIEGGEYEIFPFLTSEEFASLNKIVGEYHLDWRNNKNFSYLKQLLKPYYKVVRRYSPYYFYAYN